MIQFLQKTFSTLQTIVLFLFIFQGKTAFAQFTPVNTVDIKAIYIPQSKFKPQDGTAAGTQRTQKRIDLGYSFLIAEKSDSVTRKLSRWTGLINGSYTTFTGNISEKDAIPNRLLSSQLGVSYLHTLNKKWAMAGLLTAGINSDLENINYHALYINSGVLFINNYSPDFQFGIGGFVVNALNTPILLPGILIHFQTAGKFKFNVDLPAEVSTAYEMNKTMELKLAFRLRNMSYNIEHTKDPEKRYLNYSEYPLGLESKWKSSHFDFILGGGYVFARNFTFKESGIKNLFKKVPYDQLGGSVFISAGIKYRLQTVKK